MRDFPIFTTDWGVASLILKEIPYRGEAYIRLQDVQPGGLEPMLEECVSFCRIAGADRVFASGHPQLSQYPLYTAVWEMRGRAWVDREKLCSLFPVTESTVGRWRELYNSRMRGVDNAGTLETRDEKEILASKGAYFVHDNGMLLGIGWLDGTRLLTVASCVPGEGERVMHTLMSLVEGSDMMLEVASTNCRAISLYEKLGFLTTHEISEWMTVYLSEEGRGR